MVAPCQPGAAPFTVLRGVSTRAVKGRVAGTGGLRLVLTALSRTAPRRVVRKQGHAAAILEQRGLGNVRSL